MRKDPDGRLILEGAPDIFASVKALEESWPLASAGDSAADEGQRALYGLVIGEKLKVVNAAQNVAAVTGQVIRDSDMASAHMLAKTTDQLHDAVHQELVMPAELERQMLNALGHFAQRALADGLGHIYAAQMLAGIDQPTRTRSDEEQ